MLKNQVDIQNFSLNLQRCEPLNASNLHVPAAVAKGQLISEDFFLANFVFSRVKPIRKVNSQLCCKM